MDFKEFSDKVRVSVCEFMGEAYEVEIRKITKNNGVTCTALVIRKGDAGISPTIYLEPFHRTFEEGRPLGDIVREICKLYENNCIKEEVSMDFFLRYDVVRGRVFQKVVNYERNAKMLRDTPHLRYLDLAVVCYYAYMNDFLGKGSIQIKTAHLDQWGISQEQLFEDARENTSRKLGPEIKGMDEVLMDMLSENIYRESAEEISEALKNGEQEMPMYVMSLRGHYFGAACLCYPEWLREFARLRQRNFYILPSSVHELILVPDNGREKPESLKRMVCEVNEQQVSAEEQLSDNIYYFNLSENTLKVV